MNKNVMEAIDSERAWQDRVPRHTHTPMEWVAVCEKVLADAKRVAYGHSATAVMEELRQVAAVAVAAMEEHGAPLRTGPTRRE